MIDHNEDSVTQVRPTARDVIARGRNLVTLPAVYLKIQSLLNDPSSGMLDFARVVQSDPGLSARVLQLANSAFFGVSRKVETLSLAINLMGISRLHDLALATSVISTFGGIPIEQINMSVFWRRSLHIGIMARMLAVESGIFDSERLFVAGLLHDIGHLVMYMNLPVEAMTAMQQSRERARPLYLTEREMWQFHYGDVGSELMTLWSFPDSLSEVCRMHVDPGGSRKFPRECALVHIARHAVLSEEPDTGSVPCLAPLASETFALAGVSEITLQRISLESQAHLTEVYAMLAPKQS